MEKQIQAKDISDTCILQNIDGIKIFYNRWTHIEDLELILELPRKVILAKVRSMIKRKLISGCACGCRGDLERL